jgi:hypothetical protein
MGHDLEVGLRLTARRDSSLQTNLKQTAKGLENIGSQARRSAGLSKSASDTQTRALGNTERKAGLLTRAYQRSARVMQGWGKAMRKNTGDLNKQRKAVDLMNKGLNGVSNRYTGLVGTVGAGLTIKNVGNAQERLERLGIQAGLSSEKMKQLKNDIYATALQDNIRVDPKEILAGVESIVEKTGNLEFAEKNIRNIGMAVQATGATGQNIGELFGEFEKMGIKGPEKVAEALDILNVQGKSGAFTLQNLAALGPRVITAYTSTGREGTTALREMGAALQMIRMGTGSSEMAATAFEAMMRTMTDPAKIKKLEESGIELFDPKKMADGKRVLRPINELMAEIIEATGGDKVDLGKIFDAEAIRAFNVAATEYQKTGKINKLNEFYNVQADGSTTMKDSERAAKTFNASLTMISTSWERFADTRLTGPIESMAKLLNMLGSEGADRLWTGLSIGGGLLGSALIARKGVGLYRGAKNLFSKGKGGSGGLADIASGGGLGVQNVRIVNWPAARSLRSLDGGGGGSSSKSRAKGGRLARVAKGGWLRKGGRLLGRIGGPLAAIAGIADLGMAVNSGSSKKIGGSLGRSGGGLAGAAGGAALGSVVPVVGTLIGGIAGGILGSMFGEKLGEGAGKAMENKPQTAMAVAGSNTINIYPQPGQDPGTIADEVMRRLEKLRGGRLHD